jgi:hypothetical protein
LITLIGNKANSTDTFYKSKLDSDYYLGGLGNKRFVSLGTSENKLIFEIQDTMGSSFNDVYYQALSLKMNTTTKKITCNIPDILVVNNINIIDELGKKVNTTDLNTYALATSLSEYIKLVTNQLSVPKIVLTDTAAGPPTILNNSSGSRIVLYDLQSSNNQRTNIAIGVDANTMWFNVDGANTNLGVGGFAFYQNVNKIAEIKSNGNFTCKIITCDGLTIGTTDILTTLNNKLTNDTTQSITCNVLTAKGIITKDDKAYAHVSNTIINKGTLGFVSSFLSLENSSNVALHTMGMRMGHTTGGTLVTTTATPLKFHTYINDVNAFYNIPSLEISGTGTRDVTVFAPLTVKGALSTFENNLSIGTLQLPTSTSITTVGGVLVGGKLTVNGGAIETTKLQVIVDPSPINEDGIEILNSSNGVITKFYNENKRVDFFGETKVYGDLYSSTKIDCNLFTAKEIKQRDTNALLIKDRNNVTAIEIDELGVDILQPLSIKSTSDTIINYGISCGILQPRETIGINCTSSGSFDGNLKVYGSSNFVENLTLSRNAPTGNGNVALTVSNTSTDGQGFSSIYMQAKNESAQLFVGQLSGLHIMTHTPQSIKFKTNNNDGSPGNAMEILGTGTKDVIINTPLVVKSQITTFQKGIEVGTTHGSGANGLYVANNAVINGNLTVNGTTTFTQIANPYWIALYITYVNGVLLVARNGGRYAATSVVRVPGQPTGIFHFDFPEHPFSAGYIVSITANAGYGTIYALSRSSTRFGVTTRNTANALFDTETHVLISAY